MNRKSRGRGSTRSSGDAEGAEHVGESEEIAAEPRRRLGRRRRAPMTSRLSSRWRLGRLAVDAVHLVEQAAVVLRQADDHRLAARPAPTRA